MEDVVLDDRQAELSKESRWDFSDLRALFLNCTLKRSPEVSNTQGLADLSMAIMRRATVSRSRRYGSSTRTSPPASIPT